MKLPFSVIRHTRKSLLPVCFQVRCFFISDCWLLYVQEAHSSFPFMFVPKIFQQLSRKRVLTMEWIVGESPTDLLSVSAGSSIDNGSTYSERQRLDAKRRLLDLVCNLNGRILLFLGSS